MRVAASGGIRVAGDSLPDVIPHLGRVPMYVVGNL